jgi:hypothetical protein
MFNPRTSNAFDRVSLHRKNLLYLGDRCDRLPLGGDPRFTLQAAAPRLSKGNWAAAQRKTEMDQIALYKGFRIRAYEDWSGLWLAETKKPFKPRPGAGDHNDTDAEYIATPSGHPTP